MEGCPLTAAAAKALFDGAKTVNGPCAPKPAKIVKGSPHHARSTTDCVTVVWRGWVCQEGSGLSRGRTLPESASTSPAAFSAFTNVESSGVATARSTTVLPLNGIGGAGPGGPGGAGPGPPQICVQAACGSPRALVTHWPPEQV